MCEMVDEREEGEQALLSVKSAFYDIMDSLSHIQTHKYTVRRTLVVNEKFSALNQTRMCDCRTNSKGSYTCFTCTDSGGTCIS